MTDTSDMVGLGAYLQSITAKGGIDWNGEMQEDKARRLAMVEQANARAKEIEAHKQKMEE